MADPIRSSLRRPARRPLKEGFTLAEMVTTTAVIGLVSAGLLAYSRLPLGRDQANAAAAELVGWLDTVSARAVQYGPCTVTFSNGTNLPPGTVVARLSSGDSRCAAGSMILPGTTSSASFNVATTIGSTSGTLVFSQRAGVVAEGVEATIKIAANNAVPLRCVRVSFNSLSVGLNNSSSNVADTCTTWERT